MQILGVLISEDSNVGRDFLGIHNGLRVKDYEATHWVDIIHKIKEEEVSHKPVICV